MRKKNDRNLKRILVASVFLFAFSMMALCHFLSESEVPALRVASVRMRRDGKTMATLELCNNESDEIDIVGNGDGRIWYFNYVRLEGRWMYFDWRWFAKEVEDECFRTGSDVDVYRRLKPGERLSVDVEVDGQCQRNSWFVGALARRADGSVLTFATDMLVPDILGEDVGFELTENWIYRQKQKSRLHPSMWGTFTPVCEK